MKKIFVAIFAAVAFLAGCEKEAPVAESQDVKVTFSVTDKDGFGAETKAVKAGWEVGDEIVFIFHSGTEWLDYSNGNNTVKLTKTAGGWSADGSNVALASLTGEKYYAVHHPGQMTLGSFNGTIAEFTNYKGGEYLTAQGTYSTDGRTNLDFGTVAMTRGPKLSQFSVKDLTIENNDSWNLYIYAIVDGQNVVDGQVAQCGLSSMILVSAGSEAIVGKYGRWYAYGIQNGSDVSFCFDDLASSRYEGSDLCFKLERTGSKREEFYYRSTKKTLDEFDGHAFSLPSLESGKWKATFAELL